MELMVQEDKATDYTDIHGFLKLICANLCNPWQIRHPSLVVKEVYTSDSKKRSFTYAGCQ